ncbi:hypothetical protein LMG27174_06329 [Paraburkholderia rhynchosiae]|uniref:Uncharacterized protein n=1 Tax=Paraburkholderia rhynchosiae TaxID=487049 RepID=A0A6J5CJF2_9BURK|nr:hypothetical protein LMG27174_06329 [Paraburkholderia rhynchosiae]
MERPDTGSIVVTWRESGRCCYTEQRWKLTERHRMVNARCREFVCTRATVLVCHAETLDRSMPIH